LVAFLFGQQPTTEVAFVALPAIGIAPFANDAPSAGWSTDNVGASTWRNGTVMNTCIVSSECFPVSGSTALMSNWLRPRRRSTAADHAPSDRAVTWYGSRPGVTADWDRVFAAAKATDVAIEIDGDPSRQDIDYDLARRAVAAGCLFALDSDAHSTGELRYAETAIAHARLAGVPTERVVNCWKTERLLEWLRSRQM